MKKTFVFIGAFVVALVFTIGLNAGFKSMGHAPIQKALADIIITRTCPTCHGTGTTYIKKKCYSCPDGVEKIPVTCSTCNGTGKIKERKSR